MPRLHRIGLAVALVLTVSPARAGDPTTEQLLARIAALEQRLAALEGAAAAAAGPGVRAAGRPQEPDATAAAAKSATAPLLALDDKGPALTSAGGDVELKLHGLIQVDGRHFGGDAAAGRTDGFLLRRAEPTLEGRWGKLLGFRINVQLAGDSASINDAYVDLRLHPRASLRAGKFKPPLGLERLQASSATSSIELGLPSELAPGRDIGLQVQGETPGGALGYAAGVFNGTADGRDGASANPDGDFELVARVFLEPWKASDTALSGLGFGIAASRGDKHGAGNALLPRYRTPGQVPFFSYRGSVLADGVHLRVSPQAYYYGGRLGVLGEYIGSRQQLRAADGTGARLDHRAWQLAASYVLSGEKASYKGVVRPASPFTLDGSGWGAYELVARYGRLEIDDDAFPLFADPDSASAAARSWGIGLNWYLNPNFKLVADYARTAFDAAPGTPVRDDEEVVFTRAQFSF